LPGIAPQPPVVRETVGSMALYHPGESGLEGTVGMHPFRVRSYLGHPT